MQYPDSQLIYGALCQKLAAFRQLNLSLQDSRAARDAATPKSFAMPAGVQTEAVVLAGLAGEWLRPTATDGKTSGIVLYVHGGAYILGSIQTHRTLAAHIALAAQCATYLFDYRLAPEHPYPAALEDALATYTALQAAHPGVPIALAGDSAGGGLALALALRLRDLDITPPVALALLSPWTDLTLGNPTHTSKAAVDPYFPTKAILREAAGLYAGAHDLHHPWISPLFADLHQLPPTLIHVGENETLLDDARVLAQNLLDQKNPVRIHVFANMWHVWQMFAGQCREADESVADIGGFLRQHLSAKLASGAHRACASSY